MRLLSSRLHHTRSTRFTTRMVLDHHLDEQIPHFACRPIRETATRASTRLRTVGRFDGRMMHLAVTPALSRA